MDVEPQEPSNSNTDEPFDAGPAPSDAGAGELLRLPVDRRNPVILCNDGFRDSWQGEYALLFSATTGPTLVGIVVSTGGIWGNLEENLAGWTEMVAAARQSGLDGVPDPITSESPPLTRPSDGTLDATQSNQSEGARLIIDASIEHATSELPLVVVTGGRLTDVADAYLMDPSVAERIVVVSSLGRATETGGEMGVPNGEMDTWAGVIVAQRLRYVQISDRYNQREDAPGSFLAQLPMNAFADWVRAKQPDVWELTEAADQVGVLAVAVPEFVSELVRAGPPGEEAGIPEVPSDPAGSVMLVTGVEGAVAGEHFRRMLLDPATFPPP